MPQFKSLPMTMALFSKRISIYLDMVVARISVEPVVLADACKPRREHVDRTMCDRWRVAFAFHFHTFYCTASLITK